MRFLVYREFIRTRKAVLFSYDAAMAGGILFILVALSFRVGNLALLPQFIHDEFSKINNSVSLPMLALLSGIPMASAAASDSEDKELWRMFRKSTPVTPMKFAAAKYITLLIYLIMSFAAAFLISALFCTAADIALTVDDCAVIVVCVEVTLLFSVVMQIIQAALRSSGDKAGLILTSVIVVPFFAIGLFCTANDIDPSITPESFRSFCTLILPFAPLIIAVIFAAGIFLTAASYKRREK